MDLTIADEHVAGRRDAQRRRAAIVETDIDPGLRRYPVEQTVALVEQPRLAGRAGARLAPAAVDLRERVEIGVEALGLRQSRPRHPIRHFPKLAPPPAQTPTHLALRPSQLPTP